jgi:cytochrome c
MKNIPIPLELTEQEALDLAQFVKRVGWQEMRQNAVDEDEAYRIREALDKVRKALAEVGYAPR